MALVAFWRLGHGSWDSCFVGIGKGVDMVPGINIGMGVDMGPDVGIDIGLGAVVRLDPGIEIVRSAKAACAIVVSRRVMPWPILLLMRAEGLAWLVALLAPLRIARMHLAEVVFYRLMMTMMVVDDR